MVGYFAFSSHMCTEEVGKCEEEEKEVFFRNLLSKGWPPNLLDAMVAFYWGDAYLAFPRHLMVLEKLVSHGSRSHVIEQLKVIAKFVTTDRRVLLGSQNCLSIAKKHINIDIWASTFVNSSDSRYISVREIVTRCLNLLRENFSSEVVNR